MYYIQKTKLKERYGLAQIHMRKEISNEGQNKLQAKNNLIYGSFFFFFWHKNTLLPIVLDPAAFEKGYPSI